ncbi:MAG: DUF6279 family lipoprotein [Congregibacter sp.]
MISTTRKSPRWRFYLLLSLLFLSACSSTTFVYNRLDFIVPWYVGRYVDFDRNQNEAFKVLLNDTLEWHRSEELPRYAKVLAAVQQELDKTTISLDTVDFYSGLIEEDWYRLRDRVLEDMLQMGENLSDEQLADFIAELEKKQRKYERKYLDRDEKEFRKDAVDELNDVFKDFLGRLSDEQRARVQLTADRLKRSDSIWLEERAQWIEQTARDLEREPGWQQRIRERVINWEERLDPEILALYEHNTAVVEALVVDLFNTRSERQEKRLRRKVAGFIDDLEVLTEQRTN